MSSVIISSFGIHGNSGDYNEFIWYSCACHMSFGGSAIVTQLSLGCALVVMSLLWSCTWAGHWEQGQHKNITLPPLLTISYFRKSGFSTLWLNKNPRFPSQNCFGVYKLLFSPFCSPVLFSSEEVQKSLEKKNLQLNIFTLCSSVLAIQPQ